MLLGVPLQVAFEISNYVHVSNYIQKAELIPDVAVRERCELCRIASCRDCRPHRHSPTSACLLPP